MTQDSLVNFRSSTVHRTTTTIRTTTAHTTGLARGNNPKPSHTPKPFKPYQPQNLHYRPTYKAEPDFNPTKSPYADLTSKPYVKPGYTLPNIYTTPNPGNHPNRPEPNLPYTGDIIDKDIDQYINNPNFIPWKPAENYSAEPPQTIMQEEMASQFSARHDLEGIFKAREIDVVYITSPNGYKFRVEFNFEWQKLSKPGENSTYPDDNLDVDGIPLNVDASCYPKHLLIPGNRIFDLEGRHAKDQERAVVIFNMILKSIAHFQEFFDQYENHCEPTIHRTGLINQPNKIY